MLRISLLRTTYVIVFLLVLPEAQAQQSLPTIDVGKPRRVDRQGPRTAKPLMAPARVPAPMPTPPVDESVKVEAPTRSLTSIREAPANVTVFTGRQIQQGLPGRIGEVIRTSPSVYMRGSPNDLTRPGNSVGTLTMRGIPGSQRTMIIVDGIPINQPFAGNIDYSQIPTTGLDRIEIVPGAFSSLYGTFAMGGVVNVVSKVPDKLEYGGSASFGGFATDINVRGSAETERLSAYFRNRFENGLGVSLNFQGTNSSGYADEFATQGATTTSPGRAVVNPVCCLQTIPTSTGGLTTLLGDRGIRPWNTMNARANFYYDIDANNKVSAGTFFGRSYNGWSDPLSYANTAFGFPVYNGWISYTDQYGVARRNNLSSTASANPFLTFTPGGEWSSRSFLRAELKVGEIALRGDINYTLADQYNVNPVAASILAPTFSGIWTGGFGTYTPALQQRWIALGQADVPVTSWNMLTLGVQYQRDRFDRQVSDLSNYRDPYSKTGAVSYETTGRDYITSFFAQNKAAVTDWLTIYLGGRYDMWKTSGNTNQYRSPVQPNLPFFSNVYPERGADAFSPKASAVVTAIENLTLRASVGRAFNIPQLFQMYTRSQTTLTNFTDGDPNLKPEKLTSWEMGFDYLFKDFGTRVRATYYQNYLFNLIYTAASGLPGGVTRNLRVNAGQARILGFEAGIEQDLGFITEGLSAFYNVTNNNTSISQNSAEPRSVGKNLTFTPRWMMNAGFGYTQGPWHGEINGRYNSKVYADDQNRDVATGLPTFYDPFFTLDAKASYEITKNLKASIIGTNLTDLKYYQFYLQPARAIFGEVSYNF